jgi:hypothetical protein
MTAPNKLSKQIREIMRLAIKDDPQRLVFIGDGLVAAFDIHNGKTPHTQADACFHMEAVTIRSPMDNGFGHLLEHGSFRHSVV